MSSAKVWKSGRTKERLCGIDQNDRVAVRKNSFPYKSGASTYWIISSKGKVVHAAENYFGAKLSRLVAYDVLSSIKPKLAEQLEAHLQSQVAEHKRQISLGLKQTQ